MSRPWPAPRRPGTTSGSRRPCRRRPRGRAGRTGPCRPSGPGRRGPAPRPGPSPPPSAPPPPRRRRGRSCGTPPARASARGPCRLLRGRAALVGLRLPGRMVAPGDSMLARRAAGGVAEAVVVEVGPGPSRRFRTGSLPRVVLQAEQGEVVLVATLGVPDDQVDQAVKGLGQRPGRGGLLEPGPVDELPGGVAGLDQAVGVADEPLAPTQQPVALVGLGAEAE